MSGHKIISYYNKAFLKGARNSDTFWTAGMKGSKKIFRNRRTLSFIKQTAMKATGALMWPNMFPTALDPSAGRLLHELVRLTRPNVVLEIGTFKGYSALCLAQGLVDNKRGVLYTIDPVKQGIFCQVLKKTKLKHCVNYMIGYSSDIVPKLNLSKVDIVFIDGNHKYENCLQDFNLVKNLVHKNGFIVFHDTIALEGPRRVIKEIKQEKNFQVITLPTITGVLKSDEEKVVLAGQNLDGFIPLGLSICQKL